MKNVYHFDRDGWHTEIEETESPSAGHGTFDPILATSLNTWNRRIANKIDVPYPDKRDGYWELQPSFIGRVGFVNGQPVTITQHGPLPDNWSDFSPVTVYDPSTKTGTTYYQGDAPANAVDCSFYVTDGFFTKTIPFTTEQQDEHTADKLLTDQDIIKLCVKEFVEKNTASVQTRMKLVGDMALIADKKHTISAQFPVAVKKRKK